jgi:PKD repeat protein
MKRTLLVLAITAVVVWGCKKSVDKPVACVKISETSVKIGDTVTFTSCSTGATSYAWTLGDDTTIYTTPTVQHVYRVSGLKYVALTVKNSSGIDSSATSITVIPYGIAYMPGTYTGTSFCTQNSTTDTITGTVIVAYPGSNLLTLTGVPWDSTTFTATVTGPLLSIPSGNGTIYPTYSAFHINYTVGSWSCNGSFSK